MTDFKASDANQLLESAIYKEAFASVEADLIKSLKWSSELALQHDLVLCLQLLGCVDSAIRSFVTTGQVGEFNKLQKGRTL